VKGKNRRQQDCILLFGKINRVIPGRAVFRFLIFFAKQDWKETKKSVIMVAGNGGYSVSRRKYGYTRNRRCTEMNDYNGNYYNSYNESNNEKTGLTSQQWFLLLFSFFLGVISVLTIDRVFLTEAPVSAAVHASSAAPCDKI
jgi:hypothetical protein